MEMRASKLGLGHAGEAKGGGRIAREAALFNLQGLF